MINSGRYRKNRGVISSIRIALLTSVSSSFTWHADSRKENAFEPQPHKCFFLFLWVDLGRIRGINSRKEENVDNSIVGCQNQGSAESSDLGISSLLLQKPAFSPSPFISWPQPHCFKLPVQWLPSHQTQ